MKHMPLTIAAASLLAILTSAAAHAGADGTIAKQRKALALATEGAGYGPQSPRDIESVDGDNQRAFQPAPAYSEMNLCNIHFHENAEHKGGQYKNFAGTGDGKGKGTGYKYSGKLTAAELSPINEVIGQGKYGDLAPGDTIEIHYVHTTAQVTPGPTLGACLSDSIMNPQLRVEAQVYVLVNDDTAHDFGQLTQIGVVNGLHQALNIPDDTGTPVQYAGSTTGPGYNEKGSPLQVSWSVRPNVLKVDIDTVADWLADNVFNEDHAHGVRNLVVNPNLLSQIN